MKVLRVEVQVIDLSYAEEYVRTDAVLSVEEMDPMDRKFFQALQEVHLIQLTDNPKLLETIRGVSIVCSTTDGIELFGTQIDTGGQ